MFRVNGVAQHLLTVKNFQFKLIRGWKVDRSKVPVLNDSELEEKFIKGSGPGGQNVNKTNSCVYLLHKPTGLSVKVHDMREQSENRKIARKRLMTKLDNLINGESSVENQLKILEREKSLRKIHKQKKLLEMKEKWKKSIAQTTKLP